MLEMKNLSKVYRTELLETHALRDFSLTVEPGEFVAVTGPSGSGKTTFLNVAGLLETFEAGTYRLDGDDVSRLDDDARSRVRNRKIGFIFQSFNLIPDLDVRDNVDVPLRYRRMAGGRAPASGSIARSTSSGSPRAAATTRRSSRAGSSSASRLRARWPATRPCCWPTSPPATSTR